jgi:hypothetical protein
MVIMVVGMEVMLKRLIGKIKVGGYNFMLK